MSEREDLVERVATAILRRRAQEDYRTADDHGAWVVDHDKELARAATAECEKDRAELEAQCAAMRAALEGLYGAYELHANQEGGDFGPIIGPAAEAAQSALSPDAGRKVLDVVRAAQDVLLQTKYRFLSGEDLKTSINNLRVALAALGWKP